MTGWWVASYAVLWGLMAAVVAYLALGYVRGVGVRRRAAGSATLEDFPAAHQDGPEIGAAMPHVTADTFDGRARVDLERLRRQGQVLLVFLSALCDTCQDTVDPLNALTVDADRSAQPVAIMRGNQGACRAFVRTFGLDVPTICDADTAINHLFNVHNAPMGLLYGRDGTLVRKGAVATKDDLAALLGDRSAPPEAQANVFPRPSETAP